MARTPEELETLLEDALILRDGLAIGALFLPGALLAVGERPAARGGAIPDLALAMWGGVRAYVAGPRRVLTARDVALIETACGVNVARRGHGGEWRYAIVHQPASSLDEPDGEETGS